MIDATGFGYPYNLQVYPAVYPSIAENLYCPALYMEPTPLVKQSKLALSQPTPASDLSTLKVEGLFGYPHNLTIYPVVYPHIQDFMYRPLPPSFPVSFGALATAEAGRGVDFRGASGGGTAAGLARGPCEPVLADGVPGAQLLVQDRGPWPSRPHLQDPSPPLPQAPALPCPLPQRHHRHQFQSR
ncbi:hypothetical protein VP01_1367g12 [Puccinia sorghi]|uniref:Uncharacterized protein n=1 Tax=Puccinia sorghi TaxID=27349 RepID=A0A0L6VLS8_9BASI|nr:hypothetical protein VP01_1367g12 [Puccinia sorghi]